MISILYNENIKKSNCITNRNTKIWKKKERKLILMFHNIDWLLYKKCNNLI